MTNTILWFVIGIVLFILGFIAGRELLKKPHGLLNVDMRDPNKDYYDFVFLIPTGDIPKKKYLTIEVKTKK